MATEPRHCEIEVELTAFLQGELSDSRAVEVERHLGDCSSCAAALDGYRSVFHIAGAIEDIVPSMRFKRDVARLLREEEAPARPGLLLRLRTAGAFLAHRARTSPRFRLAAISVGVHTVLLLALTLFIVPGMVEKPAVTIRIGAGDPEFEATEHPDVAPEPFAVGGGAEPMHPVIKKPVVFPHVDHTAGEIPPDILLPSSNPGASLEMRPVFATALVDSAKIARLATQLGDGVRAHGAIRAGLSWLAARQAEDGAWAAGSDLDSPYATGTTAAAVLAFVSEGQSMARGREEWRRVVENGVRRLLESQQTGRSEVRGLYGPAEGHYNYNHALATMALTEVWVLDRYRMPELSARIRSSLAEALEFIVRGQTTRGGWRYTVEDSRAGRADTSVTIFQAMALISARGARIQVNGMEETFARLSLWLRSVTGPDGMVGYQKPGDRDRDPRTLTAGALFLEEFLDFAPPLRDRQAQLVRAELTDPEGSAPRNGLLRFFSAVGFRLRGEKVLPGFGPGILEGQKDDGSWSAAGDRHAAHGGDAFLTALNVLTLTSSYRWPA